MFLFSMLEMNPKFNFSKTCLGDLKKSRLQERERFTGSKGGMPRN